MIIGLSMPILVILLLNFALGFRTILSKKVPKFRAA